MPSDPPLDEEFPAILRELREVRRAGLTRLRPLRLPALEMAAAQTPDGTVESLLRLSVARLDEGTLRTAAEYVLGLAQGTRDWPGADRRRRAAELYGVSVERFRKDQELMVLGQVTEVIGRTYGPGATSWQTTATHRVLHVPVARRTARFTVHVHPVDLLRDVDVVVSPTNTHLALPEPYKSSVSASLRRAGAVRGVNGDILEDPVHDALRAWAKENGAAGRPVPSGTVAATGPGALAARGIRRIYHSAVAIPRPGTNDYDVLPSDVTRTAARVFEVMAEERDDFGPPLRSVCFPLLGSGRGGLPYGTSVGALWAAVEAELARGADWDVHFVMRRPAAAALLATLIAGNRPAGDPSATRGSG